MNAKRLFLFTLAYIKGIYNITFLGEISLRRIYKDVILQGECSGLYIQIRDNTTSEDTLLKLSLVCFGYILL